jgi:AcrR family transcriptional regulator
MSMPKVVDHTERRSELAQAALRVIARDGLESATTRAVAEESGWSTGVLKHYFDNKDQLLHEARRELERLNLERFQRSMQEPSGLGSIRVAVATIMQASHDESRVWTAFMNRAAVDGSSRASMRRAIEAWVKRWQALVVRGQSDGSIRDDLDARHVAVEIHALVNGLRLGAMFNSRRGELTAAGPTDLALLDALSS